MPIVIPFAGNELRIVNQPHQTLSPEEKRQIVQDFVPVTETAFQRKATRKEVHDHTVGHDVSTLLLLYHEGRPVGYYSTRRHRIILKTGEANEPGFRNVVELYGSVMDPHQKQRGLFKTVQLIASGIEQQKQDMENREQHHRGRPPEPIDYLVAKTQSGRVGATLRAHRLWPFYQRGTPPEGHEVRTVWRKVAQTLCPGKRLRQDKFHVQGAYGKRLYGEQVKAEGSDERIASVIKELNDRQGDAILAIGPFPYTSDPFQSFHQRNRLLLRALKTHFHHEFTRFHDPLTRGLLISAITEELAGQHQGRWHRVEQP